VNDFGNAAYTAMSMMYLMFIAHTLHRAGQGDVIEQWKWWCLASGFFSVIGTWTSGVVHWCIVALWLLCVIATAFSLWQAMRVQRLQREAEVLQAQIADIQRCLDAIAILTAWPAMPTAIIEIEDYREASNDQRVQAWPTMEIEESEVAQ
jgi:hypothetical protein